MASTDSRPVPIKNTAYRLYFDIRKNDGTLITTWAGQDTEVSLDGGSFTDATNEATEIGTSGCGYIDLTAAEMNADSVVVKTTVTNTSALPIVIVLSPQETGDIKVDLQSILGTLLTETAGQITAAFRKFFNVASPTGTVNSIPDAVAGANGGLPTVNASNQVAALPANGSISSATFAAGAIDNAAIAADAIGASELAASAVIEIQTGIAQEATSQAIAGYLDTEIANIQSRLPAALTGDGNLKADVLALNGSAQAAARLALSAAQIISGNAITGTLSTTVITTDLTEATDDHYNGCVIIFTSGALLGQRSSVTDYNGTTKALTVVTLTEAPANGDDFILV